VAEYDFREVEERWQRRWDEDGTYRVDLDDPRPPYYVLSMYPYPSGPAHQGHIRNYTSATCSSGTARCRATPY